MTREYFDSLNRVPNRDIVEEKDPETIQDKMAYLVHEKSFIGCEGEILSLPNGRTLMPIYCAILEGSIPIRFVFEYKHNPPYKPAVGDKIKVVGSRPGDFGELYFCELI